MSTYIPEMLKTTKSMVILASSMSLVAGAALGTAIAMKKLEQKYIAISEKEIADAKAFYSRQYKRADFETPERAAATLIEEEMPDIILENAVEALNKYQGHSSTTNDPKLVKVSNNIFTDAIPEEFDYEAELERRDPERPYLITIQEFMDNEFEHTQDTVTYYSGDQVLADSQDEHIPLLLTIGSESITRFGDGSGNPNIVYIRDCNKGIDYEVVRSMGKYSEEVSGFLAHSYERPVSRKVPKFRNTDN